MPLLTMISRPAMPLLTLSFSIRSLSRSFTALLSLIFFRTRTGSELSVVCRVIVPVPQIRLPRVRVREISRIRYRRHSCSRWLNRPC